jgi:NDP-sugar pyrophosphorylase family protein
LASLDVFVLAGGLGTRIRPVLGDTPKILAPVAGRPYLAILVDWLRRFGARRIVLGLGHRAKAVQSFLASTRFDGIAIETVAEPTPLGTAGAVRFARAKLASDPVMVMNGDSFAAADLCALVERHNTASTIGTVLCAEVADAGRYGRVIVNASGRIEAFVEKDPSYQGAALINAGVYCLSAALLDEIAAGEAKSLEREVFARLPAGTLAAFASGGTFIDIGTPESLARAAAVFAQPAN